MPQTLGFKLSAETARRLRLATGSRGQSAALREAMASAIRTGAAPVPTADEVSQASPEAGVVTITLRVSSKLATAWKEFIGTEKSSTALRAVALAVASRQEPTRRSGGSAPRPLPHFEPVAREARATLTLHLGSGAHAELLRQADQLGVTPARWTAAWLTVRLSQKPMFAGHDAQAIRQVANELAAIGRNINSIARAMNVEAGKSRVRDLELAEVQAMATEVLAFRRQVGQLASQQLAYWLGDHA